MIVCPRILCTVSCQICGSCPSEKFKAYQIHRDFSSLVIAPWRERVVFPDQSSFPITRPSHMNVPKHKNVRTGSVDIQACGPIFLACFRFLFSGLLNRRIHRDQQPSDRFCIVEQLMIMATQLPETMDI